MFIKDWYGRDAGESGGTRSTHASKSYRTGRRPI